MSSIFAALQSAGNALSTFEKAIGVTQNNVINATTPGYAREQIVLQARAFQPDAGLYGGVESGSIATARDIYAERSVWHETQLNGYFDELYNSLSPLQSFFDVSGKSGIAHGLTSLFQAFSAWSQSPNDSALRQNVMSAASELATDFKTTYNTLIQDSQSILQQIQSNVGKINSLAADIASLNQRKLSSSSASLASDPQLYADLEQLSELTNATIYQTSDGTFTVLIGGQSPLVVGNEAFKISTDTDATGNLPRARVFDGNNKEITLSITGGRLGGDLSSYNTSLSSILGNATSNGTLNDLASAIATNVNAILMSGHVNEADPTAIPPITMTPGVALFQLGAGLPAAGSISIAPGATAANLAAIDPATTKGNGICERLAALATPTLAADKINGMSYSDYLGSIASDLGNQISSAHTSQQRQTQLMSQAKSLRSEISGVSLNVEAAQLMEFQQAYEATARVFTVVNSLMDSLLAATQ